jgi:peptide chain release factor 1
MDDAMRTRLDEVEAAFAETESEFSDPALFSDQTRYAEVAKRHSDLKAIVDLYREYQLADVEATEAAELANAEEDAEMAAYFNETVSAKRQEADGIIDRLQLLLAPKDPNDDKDVIVEIRAAAGGEEAALWASDLMRMYQRYAENRGWGIEPLSLSESDTGGFREASFAVKGKGAYSRLKFEAGPHRVQRVPKTESQGRVHTSVATVAVLPEIEDVELDLDMNDVQVEVYRSSGPGGQSVNTTDSAVRLIHEPSGLVVTCQDEKSQLQNKEKAFRILRARLFQQMVEEQQAEIAANRKEQVGSGERSEKIRTYNYKDNRVSDHRIGLTIRNLGGVLEGDLDELVDALTIDDQTRRLAEGS